MQVNIARNGANFGAEASNLVSKHAGSRNLNGIVPVVIVVAQSVGEIQNGHLADIARIFGHVEMSRLDRTLCHGVRNKEEIKFAVNNFTLLNETLVHICTLRRIVNEGLVLLVLCLLEETLAHALIYNNQRYVWSL